MRKRTDRLGQDEIVSFVTFVDPLKVGVAIYAIIGIQVDLNKSRDVAEQLAQSPEVTFVGYATGWRGAKIPRCLARTRIDVMQAAENGS